MNLDRPVLIVGAVRTGKTLLARMLFTLDEFSHVYEPITIWDIGKRRNTSDQRTAEEATPSVIAKIRKHLGRSLSKLGGTRLVDDLPHHALRIPFCVKVLPEARFIHVIRDGRLALPEMLFRWQSRSTLRDVLRTRMSRTSRHSLRITSVLPHAIRWAQNYCRMRLGLRRASWGPTVPGQKEFARSHTVVETAAFQWSMLADSAENDLASLSPDRVLRIRHEELLRDPVREAQRLARFCETDDLAVVTAAKAIINPGFNLPRVHPTEEEWARIMPMIGPVLERQGYLPT